MDKKNVEESSDLLINFDQNGLVPVIVQEAESGEILMLAYANLEAFQLSLTSRYATFWSRSRKEIWKKGETSGNMMKIIDVLVDCDQDALIYKVEKTSGGACHTKTSEKVYRQSCFYRKYNFKRKALEKFLD